MKIYCLKLAIFVLLATTMFSLFSKQALAKDSYTFTWTIPATPSAIAIDASDNIYYGGFLASGSAVQMNSLYSLDPMHQLNDTKTAISGGIFLSEINGISYKKTYVWQSSEINSISLTKISTDSAQNVWLLGSFAGTVNFNSTGGVDFHSAGANHWSFLTEIKADGTYGGTYVWQDGNITLRDMVIDKNDNVFLLGRAQNNNIVGDLKINLNPLGGSGTQILRPGETLGFYLKLTAGKTYAYDYARTFTNTNAQNLEVDHLALDLNGDIYLYGVFAGQMKFSNESIEKISAGANDLYLSRYDKSGNYKVTHVIGGASNESAGVLGIDNSNNIYFSGGFNGTVNFNPTGGIDNRTAMLPDQRFLTRLNADGSYGYTLIWNSNSLRINKIAFNQNNLLYLVGVSAGKTNYDPMGAADEQNGFGENDAFITVLNANGSYDYTYVWGGTSDDKALDTAFDSYGNIYVAGSTKSLKLNFDPTGKTVFPTIFNGGENGYINEFSSVQLALTPIDSPRDNSASLALPDIKTLVCTNTAPKPPTIFQIAASANKATLNFIPDNSTGNYTISYGPSSDAEMYNVSFDYSDKSGANPYAINALSANTTYYFKVRANNGCAPGAWSQILGLKTPQN